MHMVNNKTDVWIKHKEVSKRENKTQIVKNWIFLIGLKCGGILITEEGTHYTFNSSFFSLFLYSLPLYCCLWCGNNLCEPHRSGPLQQLLEDHLRISVEKTGGGGDRFGVGIIWELYRTKELIAIL